MAEQAIYFFAQTAENTAKFETIDTSVSIQVHYYFTNQVVVTGQTNIKTNFTNPITGLHELAKTMKSYFCTSFDFSQATHDFMMTFEDVNYFDTMAAAENFKNGIVL